MKTKKKDTKRPSSYRSERAKMERMLGKKLLEGEIPVVPKSLLIDKCPVPPRHVIDFDECCADYAEGKMTEADVLSKVGDILHRIREPVKKDYEYKSEIAPPPPPEEFAEVPLVEYVPPPPPEYEPNNSYSELPEPPPETYIPPPPPQEYTPPPPPQAPLKSEPTYTTEPTPKPKPEAENE